jgi:hypothetical protein
MDSVIDEPEQRAAVAADLIQDSHGEVVGSKPSVFSSEEKLAAGISTIRLQTKRFSGAQWKKLIKERKIKQETWDSGKTPQERLHLRRRVQQEVVGV